MSDFLDNNDIYRDEEQEQKRPVFLTVLCILTFVSCGFGFISSLFGLLTSSATKQSMEMMKNMDKLDPDAPEMFSNMTGAMSEMAKWTTLSNYLALANVFICLAGALLMWKLKKMGFFIYTFGQILPIISLVGMASALQNVPLVGPMMIIGSVIAVFFALAFVVMYGLNLKHMR